MKRDFLDSLLTWKNHPKRKPLVIQGARQVGKTFLLRAFGEHYYEEMVYLNFEETPSLVELFEGSLTVNHLLTTLRAFTGGQIKPGMTLIIFDEVQRSQNALTSLKYFCEQAPEYHVVAAGSLLGIQLNRSGTFPVGKVNFLSMVPMTFPEFLEARGLGALKEFLTSLSLETPFPAPIQEQLEKELRLYYYVGGMPEAVKVFCESEDFVATRQVQQEILHSYRLDFSKYASPGEAIRIAAVWDAVPKNLAKENKKFVFSAIKKSARAREYEGALQWLRDAGLIYQSLTVEEPELPLRAYADTTTFKVYLVDCGLLGALMNLSSRTLVEGNTLFSTFKGALTENYAAQTIMSWNREAPLHQPLYYWTSGNQAEVDFILEVTEQVFPLEVKAGLNTKAKSLQQFGKRFQPSLLLRTSLQPQRLAEGRYECPLYALSELQRKLEEYFGTAL